LFFVSVFNFHISSFFFQKKQTLSSPFFNIFLPIGTRCEYQDASTCSSQKKLVAMTHQHLSNSLSSQNSSTDISRQLLMKFGPTTTPTTNTSSNPNSFSFNAPCSSSTQKASEERRNRIQKMKSKQRQHQQKQPVVVIDSTPEPETTPEPDESEQKKQKRLLRNRQAAQQSRERKKQKLGELEETINTVLEENSSLKLRIKHLEELLLKSASIPSHDNTVDYSYMTSTPSISSSGDSYEYSMQEASSLLPSHLTQSSELQLRLAGDELDSFIEEASSPSSSESFFSGQSSPSLEGEFQYCTTPLQNDQQQQHEALQSEIVTGLGFSLEDEPSVVQQILLSSSGEPAALTSISLQLEELERISYGQQGEGQQQQPILFDSTGATLATILVMISLCLGSALQSATLSMFAAEFQELNSQKKRTQSGNPSTSHLDASSSVAWILPSSPNSRRKKGRWKAASQPQKQVISFLSLSPCSVLAA
jgi:regulator of replication initiation timing